MYPVWLGTYYVIILCTVYVPDAHLKVPNRYLVGKHYVLGVYLESAKFVPCNYLVFMSLQVHWKDDT